MALKRHGTNRCYNVDGCRCNACREAHRVYANDLNRRKREGGFVARPSVPGVPNASVCIPEQDASPGRVELAVAGEIAGLTGPGPARPGLVEIALALARVLDHPRAITAKPAAAKRLADVLEAV
jgi:hypothetical protein